MPECHGSTSRFAIYFCPRQDSLLFELGSQWLGRNAVSGKALDPDLPRGLAHPDWLRATQSPRRYGFHATLKPPFRLVEGANSEDLCNAVRAFASAHDAFEAPSLRVGTLGNFLALVLTEACEAFAEFAGECVRQFDSFRAPATEEEIANRLHDQLSEREREHVRRWGYPYVFDTWKFHMSLTGSLQNDSIPPLEKILARRFSSVCAHPVLVDSICIFHEPAPGSPLHLLERNDLRLR